MRLCRSLCSLWSATARAPRELRDRVLRTATSAPRHLPLLDHLWDSRVWWLSWTAAMLVLSALQFFSATGPGEGPDLRRLREHQRQIESALELERAAAPEPSEAPARQGAST